ncbi:hypothetical protein BGP_6620 [Beggiatoa sp. PS]|nr:hypothetical protein BGP_6620 [Beggiatoa sp. PS]
METSEKKPLQTVGWWAMSIVVVGILGLIAWQIWKAEQYNQAVDYATMGERYRVEGDLEQAEEMYLNSLEIFQALENKQPWHSNTPILDCSTVLVWI